MKTKEVKKLCMNCNIKYVPNGKLPCSECFGANKWIKREKK